MAGHGCPGVRRARTRVVAWLTDLLGQVVGLGTAPLIYYIEEHPTYLPVVDPFFDALANSDVRVITSTITLVEVLAQPLRRGDNLLVAQYKGVLLTTRGLTIHALSPAIAEEAARLRAEYAFRTPDAVQLATALVAGATAFLTNDVRLVRFPELRVLALEQLLASR
jgi:predicted nucleic acid-binding protein